MVRCYRSTSLGKPRTADDPAPGSDVVLRHISAGCQLIPSQRVRVVFGVPYCVVICPERSILFVSAVSS
jgi:hypothetical protein